MGLGLPRCTAPPPESVSLNCLSRADGAAPGSSSNPDNEKLTWGPWSRWGGGQPPRKWGSGCPEPLCELPIPFPVPVQRGEGV